MTINLGLRSIFGIILCAWSFGRSHAFLETHEWQPAGLCPPNSDFNYPCPSHTHFAGPIQCIPTAWLCDNEPDCPDGTDEGTGPGEPCHEVDKVQCEGDQFLCKSEQLCITKAWKCDGDLDCDDGSDEHVDNCQGIEFSLEYPGPHLKHIIPCTPNQYQCPGSQKCIPYSKVCDNHFDCDSGTDEYSCRRPCKESIGCLQCVDKEGAKCYCDDGFQWDGAKCIDLDECNYDQYCDQMDLCTNSDGGFNCSCREGYLLLNNTRCIAINEPKDKPGTLLLANNWDMRQLDMDGKHLNPSYVMGGQRIVAVDYDFKDKKICWISLNGNTGRSSLLCSSADDPSVPVEQIKIKVYLSTVESFAYDWIHRNWYFTDPVLKRVIVCKKDGEFCNIIVGKGNTKGMYSPRSLVLDPINGYLYFTDVSNKEGSQAKIMKCRLDGSDLKPFISEKILKPAGLAIDYANGHFYWSDTKLKMVERIDLDGNETSKRVIAIGSKVENIHSLDILENYLYLSDGHEKQILKIHRYDYGVPAQPLVGNLSRPEQIRIYHKQRQPEIEANPCSDAGCPHICTSYVDQGTRQTSCLCAFGHKLNAKTCEVMDECVKPTCDGRNCDMKYATNDSATCTLELCSSEFSFCASIGSCLPSAWWCDGKVDCTSGEDEGIYCRYRECSLGTEFQCASGNCVDFSLRCNRFNDCADGTDEIGCEYPCDQMNQFQCKEDPNHCIPEIFVCDGHPDCVNGSDEHGDHCNPGPQFQCQPDLEYQCRNGECISLSWKCDDDEDCADGSDEWEGEVCNKDDTLCKSNERPCDTHMRCIPENWFCDGEPDCQDRSDEADKYCSNDTLYHCPHPNVRCEKNSIRMCLKPEQLCDGVNDCDGKTDEGGLCNSNMCNQHKICQSTCHNIPTAPGYVCSCPANKKLDSNNVTCVDAVPFDERCSQWGICGQDCELTNTTTAGYRCKCFEGFFLEQDKFTCKPLESHPVHVVFSNRHELRRVDVMSTNAISLVSGLRNTIAIDFYYKDGHAVLFWTDVMEDKIYRGTMIGNNLVNVEPIITSGLATTEGVAVDWIAENIYWVESSLDQIEVAKLDGSKRTTLIAGSLKSPRAIVLDPRDGKLFWTDWDGDQPRIEMCSMSGDYRKVIHNITLAEGGGWPNGLTIDYDFRRLYWIDARSESIHTINYDGKDSRLILKGHKDMTHPFAMSLFGNHVYWTDWSTNSVVRANKFNGSNVETVQKTITQPFDLQVIHPKRQPAAKNPCEHNNGGCSDLCLINIGGSVGCRCPHRKRLKDDNKTCVDDVKFMLFIKNQEIRGVDLDKADFNVIPVFTVPEIDQPQAIDYDPDNDTLYWVDNSLKVINRANFNGEVETLIDKGLDNPEAFAVDWLSKNMYFSSYNLDKNMASISVATLQGTFRTELIKKNLGKPNSIALDPYGGFMFFTDVNGSAGTHRLYRAQLDGGYPVVLLSDLNLPKSLTFYEGQLHFINKGNNSILTCDTEGGNVRAISNANITRPSALTVYKSLLYVADGDRIVSVNKADGSGYKLKREATPNVNALLIYDEQEREKKGENRCHNGTSGCSQLCLPTSRTMNMCKCTAGFDLSGDNNKICQGIRKFLLYAKETEIRGQKFTQSTTEALVPISQIQSASAIDFLASEDYVFWVDQKANSISRIKRDSTKRAVIVRDGINSVEGLAVDWIAGHIYWTDAGHSTIEVSKVDGSNRYVIASGSMEKPCSIVVHPEIGYLYWSDWGTEPRIERARLDGSSRHLYIYSDMVQPWGLTIDYETHVLYWCDAGLQTIERVDLLNSGSYKRKVLIYLKADGKDHQPVSLTIFKDKIYWIDRNNGGAIYSADKTTGADITKLRGDLGSDLRDIKTYDFSRQSGTNPCQINNGGCKELCFYLGNGEVRCACSYGKLDSDNRSCVDYKGFLMYSKVTGLESINLHDADNKNHPVPPIKNDTYLRNVIGLTSDYDKKRIFYSDIQRGDIQYVNFDGKNVTVVVDGIGSAEGLAFVKGKLYWTSYTNSCISSIDVEEALTNRSKKPDVVIQMSKMDHPRAIVADSCWELIYWTNWNSEKPRIQRATLQGINPTDVITKDIVTPNGLAIDHIGKKLYWSDARLDKIERCDMDGTNRHVIITAIPHHSFGLAIYGNYLYWTDWMLRAVVRANKYDGTGIVWLRKNLERQPMGIVAVAEDSNDCKLHACYADNNNCSDKCYTDETGQPFCQCTYGRLKADGKSCELPYKCDPRKLGYEPFMCHRNGMCIHFYKSCNGVPDCIDGSDELKSVCANRECPPTMFTCSNRTQGQCIPLSKKCDMQLDCKDGSDESYEFCQCPPGHFLCKSNECIPKTYRCDGNGDCADNSDEAGCDAFACGPKEKKCATYNDCIPADRWCDGFPDCQDHSDENVTVCNGTASTCGPDMYPCDNGQCIYKAWKCDKDVDCEDGSDEKNCNHTCKEGFIMCKDDMTCISSLWKCDGNNDCEDGSDELDCAKQNCTEDQYPCSNTSRCISKNWLCDGELDCQNGEDESSKVGCDPVQCFHDEFVCANNQCIDKEYYCDRDDDCGDGSDERDCDYSSKCPDTQFECDEGYCISKELRCNGEPNCADGSDEKGCDDPPVPCSNSSQYRCTNGVCLADNLVCNGRDDCGDNSDEPGNCGINECTTIKHACSQKCKDKKIGYECSCDRGFKLDTDQTTCIDIDECSTTYPCDQYCYNLHGSYYCGCAEHYQLLSDKHHCRLTNDEGKPYLLVSNRFYIRKVDLNGTHTIIVKNLTHSVAIDFDFQTNTLFWTDIHSQSSTINSILMDSPDAKPVELHSSTVLNPDGIAVDWVGRNLYWCDRNTDTIEVSKLTGQYRKILVRDKSFLREPRALEIFPKYGYLYLTDWGDEPHISRISMDGSIKEHIITEEIAWPNALTIDYVTEKLFWADANFDYIAMADLNGKNRHVIVNSDLPHTFAITTFMERLYWTDWETNSIFSVEKFSGKKRTKLVTMAQRPMDLVMFHRMRQPEMTPNPCEALNCSHLCLLRPGNATGKVEAICACPEHHTMDPDKKNCTAECNKSQFLCVSSSKCIPLWWKCDNHTDCDDGSDEPDGCPLHYCSHPGLFQCANATSEKDCIPPIGICDGVSQCADGSDETYMNNCSDYTCMTHQFQCPGSFKCIGESKLCDNNPDCPGGEDEQNCTATQCQATHFKCNGTGTCIPYLWQCDGDNDCRDGSDEIGCDNRTCIDDFIKCEKTFKCIPASWKCDGEHDCGADDDTDEKQDLCAEVTCPDTYHRCQNSHCVPGRWVCDDDKDCSDGSDELDCQPKNCSTGEFKCINNNRCVPASTVCDGKFDCRDKSDEDHCQHGNQCTSDQFRCKEGTITCIPKTWTCDGDEDCMDGSDERECTVDCHPGEFKCSNSTECIPAQFRCDTEQDCEDGSDELGCENYACLTAKFRCEDHTCIPMHKRCDGVQDCADDSDEKKSMCAKSTLFCEGYRCKNNRTCIQSGQVCDGVPDCDDGDDELPAVCESSSACKLYQQTCGENSNCIYYQNISLTSCKCKDGYKMSTENVCTVHDPCEDWKTCSQQCKQIKDSKVHCSCQQGYNYSAEMDMCLAIGVDKPILMVVEEDRILQQAPTFMQTEPANRSIDANDTKITAVDIDMSSESKSDWVMFLVYEDRKLITSHKMINMVGHTPVNGSERVRRDVPLMENETIIVRELSKPSEVAVDWIGKHIYWTDMGLKRIQMCKYDGSRYRTVVKDGLNRPNAIVVEPNLGKIFWTDVGYPPKIESAHLDGSNRRTLVSVNVIWPNGLAIDYPNQRLYWTDTKSHTVETSWLDGTDRKIVRKFNSTDPPYKIDVFEDYLYVSTYKQHRILKFHKFYDKDSNNSTLTLRPTSPLIGDILIYHHSKQQAQNEGVNQCSKDPCNSNKSKQLCINNPANATSRKYTCVCPDGANYDPADKMCSFKLCPPHHCRNNGTCLIVRDEFKCSCPAGFSGKQCEIDPCENYCPNGHCSVLQNGTATCMCHKGFKGARCDQYVCSGYCKNLGICQLDRDGNPHCVCLLAYTGPQCEKRIELSCTDFCVNNGTCMIDSKTGRRTCTCPPEFAGDRCDQCGLQHSTHLCYNGGVCTVNNSIPVCKCPPGFDPRTDCKKRTCDGYCMNEALCTLNGNQLTCQCKAGFDGPRCQNYMNKCSPGYCKNNGTCVLNNAVSKNDKQKKASCQCPTGFFGSYCENEKRRCFNFCKNGGNCTFSNSDPYCTCPNFYKGKRCEQCTCVNGDCFKPGHGPTKCLCRDLYEGPFCNRSICHDYCLNNGVCQRCERNSNTKLGVCQNCKCPAGFDGIRCETRVQIKQGPKEQSTYIPVVVPIVIIFIVVLAILIFVVIKKKRSAQFRHSRLKEGNNLNVTNPIYMPQTMEEEEVEDSRQPLDQPYDFDPEKESLVDSESVSDTCV